MELKKFEEIFKQEAKKAGIVEYNLFYALKETMDEKSIKNAGGKAPEGMRTIGIHMRHIERKGILGKWKTTFDYFLFDIECIKNCSDKEIIDTMRHELAHKIVDSKTANNHGKEWEKVYKQLTPIPPPSKEGGFLGGA